MCMFCTGVFTAALLAPMMVGAGPVRAVQPPFAIAEHTIALTSTVTLRDNNPAITVADPVALPDQPYVIPREVWGAREPSCNWLGTDGNRITHAVIHHTYEETGEPSIESAYEALQHIQNLHMDKNDWCDIGYSYLVDWFGNVYEGSRGTIERPITSAHTAGMNFEGAGIALIGRYTDEPPTEAAMEAAGKIAGWVLGFYGVEADQDVHLTVAGGNNRWANGTRITVPAITGHRDLVQTECPGDATYARMDQIRAHASAMTATMQANGEFGVGSTGAQPIFLTGTEPIGPTNPEPEPEPTGSRPGFGGSLVDNITQADPETLVGQSLQLWWIGGGIAGIGILAALWLLRHRRLSRDDR